MLNRPVTPVRQREQLYNQPAAETENSQKSSVKSWAAFAALVVFVLTLVVGWIGWQADSTKEFWTTYDSFVWFMHALVAAIGTYAAIVASRAVTLFNQIMEGKFVPDHEHLVAPHDHPVPAHTHSPDEVREIVPAFRDHTVVKS